MRVTRHPWDVWALVLAALTTWPLIALGMPVVPALPLLLVAPGYLLLMALRPRRRVSDDEAPLPEAPRDPFEHLSALADEDALDEMDALVEEARYERELDDEEGAPEFLGADVENRGVPPAIVRYLVAPALSALVMLPWAGIGLAVAGAALSPITVQLGLVVTVAVGLTAAFRWYQVPVERRFHFLAGDRPDPDELLVAKEASDAEKRDTEAHIARRLTRRMDRRERAYERAERKALRRIERQLTREMSKEEARAGKQEERVSAARRREETARQQYEAALRFEQERDAHRLQARLEAEEERRIEEEKRGETRQQLSKKRIEELSRRREVEERRARLRAEARRRLARKNLARMLARRRMLALQAERLRFDWVPIDAIAAIILTLVLGLFVAVGEGIPRAIYTYAYLFTVPGWMLIFALFPERRLEEDEVLQDLEGQAMEVQSEDDVDLLEYRVRRQGAAISRGSRLGLSLGTSVMVTVLLSLVLHWSVGVTAESLFVAHLVFVVATAAIGSARWFRLLPHERFFIHLRVDRINLGHSNLDRVLTVLFVVAAVVAAGSISWVILGPKDTSTTAVYVLGAEGEGRCYPTVWEDNRYRASDSVTERRCPDPIPDVTFGIVNREGVDTTYWVRVVWASNAYTVGASGPVQAQTVDEWSITLPPSEDETPITFTPMYEVPFTLPPPPYQGVQHLVFQVWRDEPPPLQQTRAYFDDVYREVHFVVENHEAPGA